MKERGDLGKGDEQLVCVRRALHELWKSIFEEGGFRGRTWGQRGKNAIGPFAGSHIIMGDSQGNIVLINHVNGKLQMHEFSETQGTELGNRVRSLLKENGIEWKEID